MLISSHKTKAIFERYNIVDERDVSDAMTRPDAYSWARTGAEAAVDRKKPKSNRHIIGTRAKSAVLESLRQNLGKLLQKKWCERSGSNRHGC